MVRVVDGGYDGQRLDNFLARECGGGRGGVPKPLIYKLIRSGQVRVNGRRAKPDARLVSGDKLRLPPLLHHIGNTRAAIKTRTEKAAPALAITILYENGGLLAVDKPCGLAVHGGSGARFGVIERLRQTRNDKYLELAHRLDRDTSGALLLATKPSALRMVQKLWRERKVRKHYHAAVFGEWRRAHRLINLPLRRARTEGGIRVAKISNEGEGAQAITKARLLRQLPGAAMVEAQIITGRMHQIRAHFAAAGLPVIGDDKYGDFAKNRAIIRACPALPRRLFLHACQLAFVMPDGEEVVIDSPLPAAFEQLATAGDSLIVGN